MYIHFVILTILWCFTKKIKPEIIVQESGVSYVNQDDNALIFYITLENTFDTDFQVYVNMLQCCLEIKPDEKDCNSMNLMGGDMGTLFSRKAKNVTLIYPNLYLDKRKGTCKISINYQDQHCTREIIKEICFQTSLKDNKMTFCSTDDLDALDGCAPVDCTVKYSGWKSFFNHMCNKCEKVPFCVANMQQCLPDIIYSVTSNNCKHVTSLVDRRDLEIIESDQVSTSSYHSVIVNAACHHGTMNTNQQCECLDGWTTTPDDDDYEPRLSAYHMCNIEIGAWNTVNRSKIKTTTLIISIFAITIVSKIIILMCILNWCYKYIKKPLPQKKKCTNNPDDLDPDDLALVLCEDPLCSKLGSTTAFEEVSSTTATSDSKKTITTSETYHMSITPCVFSRKTTPLQPSSKSQSYRISGSKTSKTDTVMMQVEEETGVTTCSCFRSSSSYTDDFEIEFSGESEEDEDEVEEEGEDREDDNDDDNDESNWVSDVESKTVVDEEIKEEKSKEEVKIQVEKEVEAIEEEDIETTSSQTGVVPCWGKHLQSISEELSSEEQDNISK